MTLQPHSKAWYDRLSKMQAGYYFPWKSTIPQMNGEDTYRDLVYQHLSSTADILDSGCGHGDFPLEIAAHCRSILAYDRVSAYINIAHDSARRRKITNVTFLCADSSAEFNDGKPRIPAEPGSFDLLISRRGPLNWIEDARRVARPKAVLIQLNPEYRPVPPWNDQLPAPLRLPEPPPGSMREAVLHRLEISGLTLHSCWSFDVPEVFTDPEELYISLVWGFAPGEVPAYREVRKDLEGIFRYHSDPLGVVLRFRRFLWKTVVD